MVVGCLTTGRDAETDEHNQNINVGVSVASFVKFNKFHLLFLEYSVFIFKNMVKHPTIK